MEHKKDTKNKDVKKNTKEKISFKTRLFNFFNSPQPIIVALSFICVILLVVIVQKDSRPDSFYFADVQTEDIGINTIHYFTSDKLDFFYSSSAGLLSQDYKVYNYQLGYYVVDSNDNYYELATRSNKSDTPVSLKDIVASQSSFNISEYVTNDPTFFTKDVLNNITNLHFVVKASTTKDSNNADVNIDIPIEVSEVIGSKK